MTRDGTWPGTGRRALLLGLVAGMAAGGRAAVAEAWPARPLRMVIPFPPGGPSDGVGRLIGDALSARLGQPVVVDNRPGAGSIIGTTAAAQSADGHTLLLTSNSFTVNPSLHARLPYDPVADFEPIGLISNTPLVVVVPASSPLRSVAELIAAARARPGVLTYASAGNGTVNHLAAELFKHRLGLEITQVSYRGDAALLPDLLNGTISCGFINLPTVLPLIRQGQLRPLAVMSEQRLEALPEVPTLAAEGVDGLEVGGMQALLAARGIPEEGLRRLDAVLVEILAEPEIRTRLAALGALPARGGREHLREFLAAQTARWREVVRTAGIRPE